MSRKKKTKTESGNGQEAASVRSSVKSLKIKPNATETKMSIVSIGEIVQRRIKCGRGHFARQ